MTTRRIFAVVQAVVFEVNDRDLSWVRDRRRRTTVLLRRSVGENERVFAGGVIVRPKTELVEEIDGDKKEENGGGGKRGLAVGDGRVF